MYQTVSNSHAFIMGSCAIYVSGSTDKSTTTGSYLNLGSARGVKITEAWDSMEVETDNTAPIIIGAKNQTITIEGNLLELNFEKLNYIRGGMSSFSTATFTFNSGGTLSVTPQIVFLKHTGATSTDTIYAYIYYASLSEGMTIPFPGDDKTDVAEIPFKFKGVCMSTRTAGEQLYSIVDGRANVYFSTYAELTP